MEQDQYGFYCLAFLDILDQRRKLRQLPDIPKLDDQSKKLLTETVGYVRLVRQDLDRYFERFAETSQHLAGLPQDVFERILSAKKSVKYRGFSDSLYMSVAFMGDHEQFAPMTGVYGCLGACCTLHLLGLARQNPLRGGIDVGPGLDLTEHEVYGPVLEKAIFLEKPVADYPRIVVGEGLIRYLNTVASHSPTTPLGRVARQLAVKCKSLIAVDSDGLSMLDFLGKEAASLPSTSERKELFTLGLDYANRQKQKAYSERDHKLYPRYYRLCAYFESRSALWQ